MTQDPMIDEAMRQRIGPILDEIERHEGVRILVAVESGSRAWRFASRDSDYDVRFIYVRPAEDYLSVETRRDVIELPVDGTLDVNGWDLRKALGLIAKSNAVVTEWLTSPVIYRREDTAAALLLGLAGACAYLPALAYHYDRSARRAWSPGNDPVRLKSYFYALRPALALDWIRRRAELPPMDLPSLMEGASLPSDLRDAVHSLLLRKRVATESDTAERVPPLEAYLAAALSEMAPRPGTWDRAPAIRAVDEAFRALLQTARAEIPDPA
ncbi:nucleotidyltransferase domain-containing protein [Inquilinus sp. OTU3971]|uniref:nucleotidyltransferase domain-containing protein n=1 Tax=Inquilinus sp. OTU3971 TaxID=3043855 RepID=UPI00313E647D